MPNTNETTNTQPTELKDKYAFTISKADVDKAKEEYVKKSIGITECCVIYQCLKRNGFPIGFVVYDNVYIREPLIQYRLSPNGRKITTIPARFWDYLLVSKRFSITKAKF